MPDSLPEKDIYDKRVRVIPTGLLSPAKKRDIALNYAKGEILAFIDDDAYPHKDWLSNAIIDFKDELVAAVGGPAVTPLDDNRRQKASGIIYSSFLVSGKFTYRYIPKKKLEVNDYPTCNLLVRKSIMQQLGGFNTNFWPGEDTKLCLDITKRLNKKIIYNPGALVYHHRRPLYLAHLKQVVSYALHRGYFVKKYPETSFNLLYSIPSLFLLFLLAGAILSFFFMPLKSAYLLTILFYMFLVFIVSVSKDKDLILLVFPGIILTHLTYGFYFLKGLVSQKLKEEL